jgi:hypothetical protein
VQDHAQNESRFYPQLCDCKCISVAMGGGNSGREKSRPEGRLRSGTLCVYCAAVALSALTRLHGESFPDGRISGYSP